MRVSGIHTVRTTALLTPSAPRAEMTPAAHPVRRRTETLGMSRVQKRFATLKERFLPDKAKGVNGTLQFNIEGKGGGKWNVAIRDGKITVTKGSGAADVTITANSENYEKVASGEMNGKWAVISRKMKVDGDKDLAKKFKELFRDF